MGVAHWWSPRQHVYSYFADTRPLCFFKLYFSSLQIFIYLFIVLVEKETILREDILATDLLSSFFFWPSSAWLSYACNVKIRYSRTIIIMYKELLNLESYPKNCY